MPTLKNISPYGALDIPLLGRVVEAGEVFDVTPEQARHLAGQDENFEKVTAKKKTAPARKRAAKKAAEPEVVESATGEENG